MSERQRPAGERAQNHALIPHRPGINSFLELLIGAMSKRGWSVEYDWPPRMDRIAPVTWVHWPEQLTDYRKPAADDVARLGEWLRACARSGVLVWNVHNMHRHGMPDDPGFNALYRLTAETAQVHLHLGQASLQRVRELFPAARPRVVASFRHGGCWNLLGTHTRQSARASLGLSADERVLLVFGQVREPREYLLALRAARAGGWRVLVAGTLPQTGRRLRTRIWLERLHAGRRLLLREGPFEVAQVDALVRAADAMLIPRYVCVNSGNVFLGFTFSLPVLGPDLDNVGEVLRETGNPRFDPQQPGDLERALRELAAQDLVALGQRNALWLEQNCGWEQAADAAIGAIERARAATHCAPSGGAL